MESAVRPRYEEVNDNGLWLTTFELGGLPDLFRTCKTRA